MSDDINKIINELHIYEKKVLKELEKDENASPEEISQRDRRYSLEDPTTQSIWQVCSSLQLINWHPFNSLSVVQPNSVFKDSD